MRQCVQSLQSRQTLHIVLLFEHMMQTIPIKETRANLADLINQVDVAGKGFIITKFGKPKAMLVPVSSDVRRGSARRQPLPGFGMWADRVDMKDPEKWVRKIRKKMSGRYK